MISEDVAMDEVKSVLSLMHPKLVKSFKALEKQSAIYRPEGRGRWVHGSDCIFKQGKAG